METVFVCNGEVKLIIIPQNQFDLDMIKRLTADGPIHVEHSPYAVGLVDKSIKDTLIISKKIENDSSKT